MMKRSLSYKVLEFRAGLKSLGTKNLCYVHKCVMIAAESVVILYNIHYKVGCQSGKERFRAGF
jgi:hypothetical protein